MWLELRFPKQQRVITKMLAVAAAAAPQGRHPASYLVLDVHPVEHVRHASLAQLAVPLHGAPP